MGNKKRCPARTRSADGPPIGETRFQSRTNTKHSNETTHSCGQVMMSLLLSRLTIQAIRYWKLRERNRTLALHSTSDAFTKKINPKKIGKMKHQTWMGFLMVPVELSAPHPLREASRMAKGSSLPSHFTDQTRSLLFLWHTQPFLKPYEHLILRGCRGEAPCAIECHQRL